MLRHRAVGLYHDLELIQFTGAQKTIWTPIPCWKINPYSYIDFHEIFIKPDIENLTQNYDAQNNIPAIQLKKFKISLDNAYPEDIQG